jgi:hypothetical protein
MKADCDGVAGFFEDLPVLMFVLTGVFIVVAAGVWTSNTLEAQRTRNRLELLADGLLSEIVLDIEARSQTSPEEIRHLTAVPLLSLSVIPRLDGSLTGLMRLPIHPFKRSERVCFSTRLTSI